jgi:mercuric ion binding protein
MKTKVILSMVFFFLVSVVALNAQEKKSKEVSIVRFSTSIDCENCVNTIMKNVPFEKGVKDVSCDLETKEVTVKYKSDKTSPELLKRAIEKLGYTAQEIPEKEKQTEEKK